MITLDDVNAIERAHRDVIPCIIDRRAACQVARAKSRKYGRPYAVVAAEVGYYLIPAIFVVEPRTKR